MKITAILVAAIAAFAANADARPAGCQTVSVVGDATYCIAGPVCSGTTTSPGGKNCPQVGDTAIAACLPNFPAFNTATGKCTAPVPADCTALPSGAWGCVWDLSKLPAPGPAPPTTSPTVAPSTAPTTAPTTEPTTAPPAKDCEEVTVVGDGLFCIKGPVCKGLADNKGGDACPQKGDTAIAGCSVFNPSYDAATGKCTGPVPSVCQPTNGVWACNWDLAQLGLA